METALTNLEMTEIDRRHRAVKGRLTQIKTDHGSLKLIDLPDLLEKDPSHPIKKILAELLILHTPLAPFVEKNVPASDIKTAMQELIDHAFTISYRKLFTTSRAPAGKALTSALKSAGTNLAILGPKNGRCCGRGVFVCQPGNPNDFCTSVNNQCSLASNTNCASLKKREE